MILGKNLTMTLSSNGTSVIAASKSCNLQVDTDFIEVCSPVDGSWKEYIPSIKSWSASVDMLVSSLTDHKQLLQLQNNYTKLTCLFFDEGLQECYKGYCYIKNLKLTGTVGSLATMSVALQTTGRLEMAEATPINMTLGTAIDSRKINFVQDVVSIANSSRDSVSLYEIQVANDTRITLSVSGIVVEDSLSNTSTMISDLNNTGLNNAAILINSSNGEKSVVATKKSTTYPVTVIVNGRRFTSAQQGWYLSKL
jgi:predicted secreted protein